MPNQTKSLKRPIQLGLDFRKTRRGGRRKGAGRKPSAERAGAIRHVARPVHHEKNPVHVTVRAMRSVPGLRGQRMFAAVKGMLARASEKGLRLLHFSVQGNHIHMIVEAEDRVALGQGMQRLLSRIALVVNAVARRTGRVWSDRYHRRDLASPSQVRNALVYVLFNIRKHDCATERDLELWSESLDPMSSAAWLNGWSPHRGPPESAIARGGAPIVAAPRTWLASAGWKPLGLLRIDETPLRAG